MGRAFLREEMADAEVEEREGVCVILGSSRILKLLDCNVRGGSAVTEG